MSVAADNSTSRDPRSRTGRLELRGATVAYPGTRALDDVSLTFESGRVHVLVGGNGAGKSTVIKVLTGAREPDRGELVLDGQPLRGLSPAALAEHGVRVSPQELQLFPTLTVWENVTAGIWVGGRHHINQQASRAKAMEALARLGEHRLTPNTLVSALTPAEQQRVVIARAIADASRFLILDEPTANLARSERAELLGLIRSLAGTGVGVIFVSHHLDEVMAIADEVSVLRDGMHIWTRSRAEVDEDALVAAMFGTDGERETTASDAGDARDPGAEILRVQELHWHAGVDSLELSLRRGEILGVAGLPGSGADRLLGALIGSTARRGRITLEGTELPNDVGACIDAGLGIIPPDRKAMGLFLDASVRENICAASLADFTRGGLVDSGAMDRRAREIIEQLHIVPVDPALPVRGLSGGNQQKVLVGRWIVKATKVLLADEPTRGTDVASKREIHQLLRAMSARGSACMVYGSDLSEVIEISDRILVLRRDGPSQIVSGDLEPEALYEAMSGRKL